jgi:hypothetical protein
MRRHEPASAKTQLVFLAWFSCVERNESDKQIGSSQYLVSI